MKRRGCRRAGRRADLPKGRKGRNAHSRVFVFHTDHDRCQGAGRLRLHPPERLDRRETDRRVRVCCGIHENRNRIVPLTGD